ncbi:hypothetical protein AAFG07_34615 [Bradyrhizobium sp. B097]|uniref:hypothetical protein n=1 Tax=Bradyrhizobium sp. B097 TaxID=3140244 RepID=UPI003182DFEA
MADWLASATDSAFAAAAASSGFAPTPAAPPVRNRASELLGLNPQYVACITNVPAEDETSQSNWPRIIRDDFAYIYVRDLGSAGSVVKYTSAAGADIESKALRS